MVLRLHQEFDGAVVAVHPWGLEVEFEGGTRGLIDNTKDPAWPSGDRSSIVGEVLHVVVIDDQRDPVRLSALDVDLEIARTMRPEVGG
ncbi:hypothetical protein [Krasilnikovia sp. MM14-A1004]|uniref:hypothetical protein n=1 Tax=Krasilnikovia sp. MM14-A1004 TaxID=3373541 RepID=UPI00399CB4FD